MQYCILSPNQLLWLCGDSWTTCSPAGNNLVEAWYCGLGAVAQAEFDVTLKTLSISEDWRGLKEFKHMGREGLCEVRFKAANVQYRPFGFFGPGPKCFSIYIGCKKKGGKYDPPNAVDLAYKNRKLVEQKEASLIERFV